MRATITREHLSAALETAARAVGKPTTLPILSSVLLEATPDGGVVLTGADLRTRAWHTVPASVEEAGAVALPPARIASFLEAVPDDAEIRLSVDAAYKAVLSAGKTTSRIAGLDPEEFPAGPSFDAPSFDCTFAADVLVGLIQRTAYAASKNDSRPVMAGVLLAFDGATVAATAADGYRLAHAEAELPEGSWRAGPDDASLIVPARPLVGIARELKDASSARMLVDAGGGSLLIDSETGRWSILLIDGTFPDFRRIVPRDTPIAVTTSRSALLRALRLVRNLEGTSDGYRCDLAFDRDALTITAADRAADHEASTTIDADLTRGDPMALALNTQYLAEAVEAIEGDGVVLEMTDATKPVLFRSTHGPATDWGVAMPVHKARL